ncbi:hypothetical protein CWT12_00390 [Actinomyces sp. 432]|uniref:DUF4135 domain-containing protein n=1 Tax=Actinomyces sp. 432 TaxID=2057798 RepID=UPI00137441A7|nr:DUF4135 domain-containing protein [Actinomyces sp. 432]QHO90101.1 hypothetical protein CWT12_00390 [Actinomyces sp. 432]
MTAPALPTTQTLTSAFDAFHPFLQTVTRQALQQTRASALAAHLIRSVQDKVLEEASRIWFRALLEEFHEFRDNAGLPMQAGSQEALRRYAAHLCREEVVADLRLRWPTADQLLRTRASMHVANASQLAQAWEEDRQHLVSCGLLPRDFEPEAVTLGKGDSHNGGRSVTVLSSAGGERILFKPHSADGDLLLADLLALVSRYCGENLTGCVPRTLASSWGSWQEFVPALEPTTPGEVSQYFYRFGLLAALLTAIGAGDLHHENVIVRGPSPCVIDTEALLQPGTVEPSSRLGDVLLEAGERSPGSTLMLPMRVREGAFDILLCALGVPWEQVSRKSTFALLDDGTDAVRMARSEVQIDHEANVVRLYGEVVDPVDHIDRITAGYLRMHAALRECQEEVVSLLQQSGSGTFRVVLRPTETYTKLLDASVQLSALRDARQRQGIISVLRDQDYHDDGAVGAREREDLANFDVPAFQIRADGTRLLHHGQPVSRPYFAASPVAAATTSLRRFCQRDPLFHHQVLETSLGELAAGQGRPYPAPLIEGVLEEDPNRCANGILRLLECTAVRGLTDDGMGASWLSHLGHDDLETFELDRVMSFHDLGGLIATLVSRHPGSPLARQARAALSTRLVPQDESAGTPVLSVFAGPMHGWLSDDDTAAVPPGPLALARLCPRPEDIDLITGLSGSILAAASQPDQVDDRLVAALSRLEELLPEVCWERDWYNLAHGEVGALWAQVRARHALGLAVDEPLTKILRGLQGCLEDPRLGASWCAGASGGLIVLSDLHRMGLEAPPSTAGALAARISSQALGEDPVDLSVCHGVSGCIQALLLASETGLVPEGITRAGSLWVEAVSRARCRGTQTGAVGRTTIQGYMLGWGGLLDTMHRLTRGPGTFDAVSLRPRLPAPQHHLIGGPVSPMSAVTPKAA